jgi:hypothetical protein
MSDHVQEHTEASMLDLLCARHAEDRGNGPAWAYLEHVRNNAGFTRPGQTRTIDALALHLWESRGHDMHAYEVKVSRADFRTELRSPEKADAWCAIADYFWIVAPRGIVPKDELPATWGLLETSGDGLRAAVQAARLRDPKERAALSRGQLAAMLRAAGAGLSSTPNAEALAAAEEKGRLRGIEQAKQTGGDWQRLYEQQKEQVDRSLRVQREIEKALGVDFHAWRSQEGKDRVAEVSEALRAVLGGDEAVQRAKRDLERSASALEQQARWIREHAGRM